MSTYVMSDIHGCFDEFMSMLDKIHFTKDDTLILAGDYIDRGPKSLEMLQWLEQRPNHVICVKGNHDAEFKGNVELMAVLDKQANLKTNAASSEDAHILYDTMKYILARRNIGDAIYFDYYGGILQLINDGATLNDLIRWANMMEEMPCVHEVDAGGRHYIIVHAGYTEDFKPLAGRYSDITEFYLYAREEAHRYGGRAHCTIIAGHTPTIFEDEFTYNAGKVFRYYDAGKDCTFYDIDCGCVMRKENDKASLACMRLENEIVYYI